MNEGESRHQSTLSEKEFRQQKLAVMTLELEILNARKANDPTRMWGVIREADPEHINILFDLRPEVHMYVADLLNYPDVARQLAWKILASGADVASGSREIIKKYINDSMAMSFGIRFV